MRVSPGSAPRYLLAAAVAVLAFGPDAQDAAAGTAVAPFQVTAQLVGSPAAPGCRVGVDPVNVTCGSPLAPSVLRPRPEWNGSWLADGYLARYGNRTEVSDSVYAASLTTRVIRYGQWEYVETLVSW